MFFLKLFHADIFNKFDQHDQKFKKKISNVHFNPREEYHKVRIVHKTYAKYIICVTLFNCS